MCHIDKLYAPEFGETVTRRVEERVREMMMCDNNVLSSVPVPHCAPVTYYKRNWHFPSRLVYITHLCFYRVWWWACCWHLYLVCFQSVKGKVEIYSVSVTGVEGMQLFIVAYITCNLTFPDSFPKVICVIADTVLLYLTDTMFNCLYNCRFYSDWCK